LIVWGCFPNALIWARGHSDIRLRYACSFDVIMRARIRKPRGPDFTLTTEQIDKLMATPMLIGHRIALEEDLARAKLLPMMIGRVEACRKLPDGWTFVERG
jgi:hypothetical protein